MGRTNPVSIRFDPEKLNLVINREGLPSAQKAVDYLFDVYYWQHKLNPATKNGPQTEYEAFEEQIKEADDVPTLDLVKWAVIKSKSLAQIERKSLMEQIVEKKDRLNNQ